MHLLKHIYDVLLLRYLYMHRHFSNLNFNIIISYLGNLNTLVDYSFHLDLSFWLAQAPCLIMHISSWYVVLQELLIITSPVWVWQVSQIKLLINDDFCREAKAKSCKIFFTFFIKTRYSIIHQGYVDSAEARISQEEIFQSVPWVTSLKYIF